ncbi:hypothetical protein [Streptomyces flavidovirens]|uniref:Transposase n=1 Tax=Streptomyces flavidovirens TaxID=67298 RepID=A0ABW6RI03_9ACTN
MMEAAEKLPDWRAVDLESITDELYGLAPADFTAARNERAAAARTAGDRELAGRIQALRRPTLSAWASNLLVRRQPEQVQPLISLGEGMRRAHRDLDGEQLRELGRRQHDLVGALARQARQLAADAGHPVSEDVQHEVESTLHAVLADPGAAREWAAGRLTKPLSPPVGFTAATTPTAVPHKASRLATSAAGAKEKEREEEKERAREEQRAARLARAEKDATTAEQQARDSEEELARAETRLREAENEVTALAEQLKEAKERQKAARGAVATARDRAREAGAAARKARRRAEDAAAQADGR